MEDLELLLLDVHLIFSGISNDDDVVTFKCAINYTTHLGDILITKQAA